MELKIKKIHNSGDVRSEYIEFSVEKPVNLKNYILSDSYHNNSENKKHVYWFPEITVKAGEVVRLNTGKGVNNPRLNNLYWNLESPIWKDKFISAYLIKIDDFVTYPDTKGFMGTLFSES